MKEESKLFFQPLSGVSFSFFCQRSVLNLASQHVSCGDSDLQTHYCKLLRNWHADTWLGCAPTPSEVHHLTFSCFKRGKTSTRVTRKSLCRNEDWQQKTRFCWRGLLQLAYYMDCMHIFETNVIKTCAVWLLIKQDSANESSETFCSTRATWTQKNVHMGQQTSTNYQQRLFTNKQILSALTILHCRIALMWKWTNYFTAGWLTLCIPACNIEKNFCFSVFLSIS